MQKNFWTFLFFIACIFTVTISRADELNEKQREWTQRTIKSMSLDEKIGQLIMPAIVASSPSGKALQEVETNI